MPFRAVVDEGCIQYDKSRHVYMLLLPWKNANRFYYQRRVFSVCFSSHVTEIYMTLADTKLLLQQLRLA